MKRVKITLPKGGTKAFTNDRDDFPPVMVCAHTVVYEAEEIIIEGDVSLTQLPAARIPFDLEAAKAGAALVTRDGREVRFLAHVPEAMSGAQVLAYIKGDDDGAREFSTSGKARPRAGEALDLFMAPKNKKKFWANLYRDGSYCMFGSIEDAEDASKQWPKSTHEAIAVEIEV